LWDAIRHARQEDSDAHALAPLIGDAAVILDAAVRVFGADV
jgi:hypothetical protein